MAPTVRTFAAFDSAGKKSSPGASRSTPALPDAATNSRFEIDDRLVEDGVRPGAAPGRVDERRAVVRRVIDRLDGLIVHAAVVDVIDELQRHDRHAGGDADDARPVQRRRDRPGDVRAVTVVAGIVDRRVVMAEVPAVDVVDVAVAVVVDAVAGRLAGVGPLASREVRVAEIDTVVDHRDDDARLALLDAERLESVDIDVGDPGLRLDAR